MNWSVAYFEEHPELKLDGKCVLVNAFENPDSPLKSLCQQKETGNARQRE